MLPAWQGAGRLPSSLQKETKTELTPVSPAKVSKQMHCELWDLHSLSCLSLFACPAPFLHGNTPFKKKNLYLLLFTLRFWFYKACHGEHKPTSSSPGAYCWVSHCVLCRAILSYKPSPDHFFLRCELPFLHSACFRPGIQFLILSKPAQREPRRNFVGVMIPAVTSYLGQHWCWCGRNSSILLLPDNQEYQQIKGVIFHKTAGDRKREWSRKCHKITLPTSYANLSG